MLRISTLDRGDQGGLFGLSLHYRTREKAMTLSHLMIFTNCGGFMLLVLNEFLILGGKGDGVGVCGGAGRNFGSHVGRAGLVWLF